MRTFIAIPLPDESLVMLDEVQQQLRATKAEVRWVSIASIHLTLKFLGETEPETIERLSDALEAELRYGRCFTVRLQGLGCFPNQWNPRVIWCGIGGDTGQLQGLQQKVEFICASFGLPREKREFHPHLTLGRVTGKRNLQPLLDCIKIGAAQELSFRADHFNIYRSTLKPQGAVYSVLKSIRLLGQD